MNTLFKTNDERKISRCDKFLHKTMRITVEIYLTNLFSLLLFNQKMHVYWNLQIIYGYHFLTNHSMTS